MKNELLSCACSTSFYTIVFNDTQFYKNFIIRSQLYEDDDKDVNTEADMDEAKELAVNQRPDTIEQSMWDFYDS